MTIYTTPVFSIAQRAFLSIIFCFLEKIENLPLTISDNPEENVIKVYYKIDETQQKDLSYTVKYFKLDEEVTEDNQLINITYRFRHDFKSSL